MSRYTSLHCRSTALVHFSLGTGAASGFPVFTTENLQWPGFVEFDDVNSRVLTYVSRAVPSVIICNTLVRYNASTLTYRVWDLKTYTEIFRCVPPPPPPPQLGYAALMCAQHMRPGYCRNQSQHRHYAFHVFSAARTFISSDKTCQRC